MVSCGVRLVVCAANRSLDEDKPEIIVTGARHFDKIMRGIISNLKYDYKRWEQGFIDQYGTFLTRDEALELVKENKQALVRKWSEYDTLYSENLY